MQTRNDLIAYVESGVEPVPKIDATSRPAEGCGMLEAGLETGSVLLVPKEEGSAPGRVRAFWSAGEKTRGRPIPAGTYRIFNYVIESGKEDDYWCLSGSGPCGREVRIVSGETTRLELDRRVHLKLEVHKRRKGLAVSLGISGDNRMGLSVIHGKDRVPVRFELRDKKDERVDGATMPYG